MAHKAYVSLKLTGIVLVILAVAACQRSSSVHQRIGDVLLSSDTSTVESQVPLPTEQQESPPPGLDIPRMRFPEGNLYTEAQVIAYLKSRFVDNGASWVSHKATRTRLVNIKRMMSHYSDQDLRQVPPAQATLWSIPHWIVYFKSSRVIPNNELLALMGMSPLSQQQPNDPNLTNGSTEPFVVLDTAGNILEVGTLDPPNELGTPIPNYSLWGPDDLDSLPTVIVPTLPP